LTWTLVVCYRSSKVKITLTRRCIYLFMYINNLVLLGVSTTKIQVYKFGSISANNEVLILQKTTSVLVLPNLFMYNLFYQIWPFGLFMGRGSMTMWLRFSRNCIGCMFWNVSHFGLLSFHKMTFIFYPNTKFVIWWFLRIC